MVQRPGHVDRHEGVNVILHEHLGRRHPLVTRTKYLIRFGHSLHAYVSAATAWARPRSGSFGNSREQSLNVILGCSPALPVRPNRRSMRSDSNDRIVSIKQRYEEGEAGTCGKSTLNFEMDRYCMCFVRTQRVMSFRAATALRHIRSFCGTAQTTVRQSKRVSLSFLEKKMNGPSRFPSTVQKSTARFYPPLRLSLLFFSISLDNFNP